MRILGIHCGHNSTAFLIENGVVIAGLSQEKVDGVKNSAAFPSGAIASILSDAGLTPDDIHELVVAGVQTFPSRCYDYLFHDDLKDGASRSGMIGLARRLEHSALGSLAPGIFRALRRYRQKSLLSEGRVELHRHLAELHLGSLSRSHVDHHTCHAHAAFHGLGGKAPALVFTADGSGDEISATVTRVDEKGVWDLLGTTPETASLGGLYSATTRFLGMRPLEHEYKVMGLAPYAKHYAEAVYERVFRPVIDLDPDNPFNFKSSVASRHFYDYLISTASGERFDNIAAAVQRVLEERAIAWIRHAVEKTGIRRAYFGGGLFMNVKLNMLIQELDYLEAAHFLPSCGDESIALGAAYVAASKHGAVKPLTDLYLGLSYDGPEIERFLESHAPASQYQIERLDNVTDRVAELLAEGNIVARFSGRNEWGARSLGNRAILAHPGNMESFFTINDQIKSRDFWMPFAPTILDRSAHRYLENWSMERTPAPHMITAFRSTPAGRRDLCAAIHRGDNTLRPQVLTPDINPEYYALIAAFESKTGVGAVLNTSLNLHGNPLAATPVQAMETLDKSGLRYLAIGSFLVSKP